MIVDGLIALVAGLLRFGSTVLPDVGLDTFTPFVGQLTLVISAYQSINYYVPLAEVMLACLAVFAVLPLFLGASLTLWLVALIRGGSSRA